MLLGRDGRGGFNTTPAKQYPDRLCEFLAKHVFAFCEGKAVTDPDSPSTPLEVESELAKFYVPLDQYNDDHRWDQYGRDFAGQPASR